MGIADEPEKWRLSQGASYESFVAELKVDEHRRRQKSFAAGIGALLLLGAVLVAQHPELVWHTVATTVGNIAAQYALYRGWFDGPVAWAERRLPHYQSFARFVALAVCVVGCVLVTVGVYELGAALAR